MYDSKDTLSRKQHFCSHFLKFQYVFQLILLSWIKNFNTKIFSWNKKKYLAELLWYIFPKESAEMYQLIIFTSAKPFSSTVIQFKMASSLFSSEIEPFRQFWIIYGSQPLWLKKRTFEFAGYCSFCLLKHGFLN